MGFYELLRSITDNLKEDENQYCYTVRIWKVYMILIEYACKTDYQMITSQCKYCVSFEIWYSGEAALSQHGRVSSTLQIGD